VSTSDYGTRLVRGAWCSGDQRVNVQRCGGPWAVMSRGSTIGLVVVQFPRPHPIPQAHSSAPLRVVRLCYSVGGLHWSWQDMLATCNARVARWRVEASRSPARDVGSLPLIAGARRRDLSRGTWCTAHGAVAHVRGRVGQCTLRSKCLVLFLVVRRQRSELQAGRAVDSHARALWVAGTRRW
jgi:hypothetical protein